MLIKEFTRIDPGVRKGTKVAIILDNIVCIAKNYQEVKKEKLQVVDEGKTCVICMANGMIVLVDHPYDAVFQMLKAYNPR